MLYHDLIEDLITNHLIGRRYQREGHGKFRDCVSVYRDGRVLFERFCYGEAAGIVFSLWADIIQPDGKIGWALEKCTHSTKDQAPKRLTGFENGSLFFDDAKTAWLSSVPLKTDPKNGYGFLRALLLKGKPNPVA